MSETYTTALVNAGAIPLLIPLGLPSEAMTALLSRLDGVLFTGGGDVHPQQYGGQDHPLLSSIDPDRDRVEIQLMEHILKKELPFLGICRGIQVINVALGGSLYEDILDQRPNAQRHQFFPEMKRDFLAHPIQVESGTCLADILGQDNLPVNSLHHQGILRLAEGLKATAYAPDGIIEAFELSGHPFGLAVQWHPEELQVLPEMRQLFRAFTLAAQSKANHLSHQK